MSKLPRMATISDLIGRIYDTCLDEGQWDSFLRELTRAFGSEQALRVSIDSGPVEDAGISFVGMDMDVITQWAESKDHVDVWYSGLMDVRRSMTYRGLDLCSRETLHSSAFYSDSLRPLDIEHTLGNVSPENARRNWAMAIYRSKRAGRFSDQEAEAFQLLLPHFARAVRIRRKLLRHRSREIALKTALEKSPFGIAILDSRQLLVWANRKADEMFETSDGITIRYGRVRLWEYGSQKTFDKAVGNSILTANHRAMDVGGAIVIQRPSGEPPYHALIAPVNRASEATAGLGQAACIIILHDSTASDSISAKLIASHYGLSKAEAQLCKELYKRGSLPDVIRTLGITRNTAKTHLSHIFAKVGVSSQAQLLQRLASGIH